MSLLQVTDWTFDVASGLLGLSAGIVLVVAILAIAMAFRPKTPQPKPPYAKFDAELAPPTSEEDAVLKGGIDLLAFHRARVLGHVGRLPDEPGVEEYQAAADEATRSLAVSYGVPVTINDPEPPISLGQVSSEINVFRPWEWEDEMVCVGPSCEYPIFEAGREFYEIPVLNRGEGDVLLVCVDCARVDL
jgi:hypothetical protein